MNSLKKYFIYFIASGAGLGYSPLISGTVGSLGGVLLFLLAFYLNCSITCYLLFIFLLTLLGVWVSSEVEKGSEKKDPGLVVIDEVVGMMLTYVAVPFSWTNLLIGFVLFRILDIWKPFPARSCEKLHGGIGIMLDDVVSGIYACALLHVIILLTQ